MKAFTDIEQSKKLAEILPIESADMWWNFYSVTTDDTTPQIIHLDTPWVGSFNWNNEPDNIPCWSLAALFELLPKEINVLGTIYSINIHTNNKKWSIDYKCNNEEFVGVYSSSLVDACVEMIVKLKENNLL